MLFMKLERLQELKKKLRYEKNFSDIWSFYMDEFADHEEFTDLGEPAENLFLEATIPAVCNQIFARDIMISNLLIISIPEHQFFHAPFMVERRIGGVIYFADINMGLLAVSADYPPTDEVKYSRFSRPFMQDPDPFVYN
jgi:hypothetical protein